MAHPMSIDRFEGRHKEIAVLLDEQDRSILVPRDLLPDKAKAGSILAVTFEIDAAATEELAAQSRKIEDELTATDPGGDLEV